MRRALLGSIPLLLAATTLAACSEPENRAAPGEVVAYDYRVDEDSKTSLNLPVGTIDILSTPVLDDLEDVDGIEEPVPAPPADGGFIGFDLYLRDATSILPKSRPTGDAQQATFTLVVGDARYPLESPYEVQDGSGKDATRVPASVLPSTGRSSFVAIDGDPEQVLLEAEYDGVAQSVDLLSGDRTPGGAAAMYDKPTVDGPVPQRPCGELEPEGALPRVQFSEATCRIASAALLPYTSELGWAPAGRRWAVVSVETRLLGPLRWSFAFPFTQDQRLTTYRRTTFSPDVTLDGQEPLDTARTDPTARAPDDTLQYQDRTYTWEVGADDPMELYVGDEFSSTSIRYGDPAAPERVSLAFDQTVTLRF
ncbi:hypothetical protein [Aeromicrobium stalagmiti]|uniref:hypothetical protein n=1 Tax=Aeromicrobium stalagmiti TaxID=2738988 RepID=UPI0015683FAF|nr:hypothetical protein [Aeromicrobium stalagmiti]NRQ49925.1 hypothetical protein [Aeromicrobium stalagmiti]